MDIVRTDFGSPIVWPTKRKDGGFDFRPFGMMNYGYPSDDISHVSTPWWVMQTIASFSGGFTEGLKVNALGFALNETIGPLTGLTAGSSFLHNFLAGYNLTRHKEWNLPRLVGASELALDAYGIYYEREVLKVGFHQIISHAHHAGGFVLGILANRYGKRYLR